MCGAASPTVPAIPAPMARAGVIPFVDAVTGLLVLTTADFGVNFGRNLDIVKNDRFTLGGSAIGDVV